MSAASFVLMSPWLFALAFFWSPPTRAAPDREFPIHIVEVSDGDTLVVDIDLGLSVVLRAQKVRLAGIDAPETSTPEGKASRAALRAYLAERRDLPATLVVIGQRREKYGRWLGFVRVDGIEINAWLVSFGHARPYDGGRREPAASATTTSDGGRPTPRGHPAGAHGVPP